MIINKIEPQGFCNGVKYALKLVDNALHDPNTIKPIYLLGNLIHNSKVMDELKAKGIIIIDSKKTRLEMLDDMQNGTVIFSAHGVSPSVYEKANEKGLNIIDATCPNVLIIHNRIKSYIDKGYSIIYIGSKNHPECEGVLDINENIILVSSIDDIDKINLSNSKIYITNQTTLSKYELLEIYDKLKELYPESIIDNKICNATTLRQDAVMKIKNTDLCIVVGDKSSSNTNKLVSVAKITGTNAILIEDYNDIKEFDFSKINTLAITSGASTPSYVVDEVINFIKSK